MNLDPDLVKEYLFYSSLSLNLIIVGYFILDRIDKGIDSFKRNLRRIQNIEDNMFSIGHNLKVIHKQLENLQPKHMIEMLSQILPSINVIMKPLPNDQPNCYRLELSTRSEKDNNASAEASASTHPSDESKFLYDANIMIDERVCANQNQN